MHSSSENFRGALFMMISMAAFVFNDAIMKSVSDQLSLYQAIFLRGLVTTFLLALLAWHKKALLPPVPARDKRILVLRVIGEVGGTLCFLTALFNMPIANATAILQALPLAVTLAAALFLREPVGWRRYSAILVGFAGVLIIVRPGSEGFNAYSIWALAAVGFIVLRDLSTRKLDPQVPSIFVALLTSVFITMTGAILSPTDVWHPVTLPIMGMLSGAALFIVFGYLFAVMTMRVGDISFVSPFRYSILIWAILLGILVFGEYPDFYTLLGSGIVVAMGIYTFYRERRR